jgi:bacterioferritin
MQNEPVSTELMDLLNQALGRELHVSVQYMLQHGVEAGRTLEGAGLTSASVQSKFIGSHVPYFLPGARLKKIAITEMRHAEAITERITLLGGEPVTQADPAFTGKTTQDMLENDRQQEQGAIGLYQHIIGVAEAAHDPVTKALFQRILKDEQSHLRTFTDLLAGS